MQRSLTFQNARKDRMYLDGRDRCIEHLHRLGFNEAQHFCEWICRRLQVERGERERERTVGRSLERVSFSPDLVIHVRFPKCCSLLKRAMMGIVRNQSRALDYIIARMF